MKRVFPDAKIAIGPAIAEGFYYDFEHEPFTREDLDKLEAEMKKIIKEGCVPLEDLKKYKGQKKALYGLKVFTAEKCSHKPMDITQFNIKRPPQSWCYTEVDV